MGKSLEKVKHTFLFCDGGSCRKAGAELVSRAARLYLRNEELWDEVHTIKTRCNGRCEDAPTCIVEDGHFWYKNLNPEKVVELIKSHCENGEPIEEYLVYAREWEQVRSDNERGTFKIKPFEWKDDPYLGRCQMTKGLSSDQYLHPLFDYLYRNAPSTVYETAQGDQLTFSELTEIRFEKDIELELITENKEIQLVIGPVRKDEPHLEKGKIRNTYYFYRESTGQVGVRFSDKKNELIGHLFLGTSEGNAWSYCTRVQLQNNKLQEVSV